MNEALDLSEQQRDQLFQHFARQSLADGTADIDDFGTGMATARMAGDVGESGPTAGPTDDPLASILTPEQLDTYHEYQAAELKNSEEMLRAFGLPGGAASGTITVSPGVQVDSAVIPSKP